MYEARGHHNCKKICRLLNYDDGSLGPAGKHCCRDIVYYQCFVMFPSVDELGDIFARIIVSLQYFVTFPSVDKLGNIVGEKQCLLILLSLFGHVTHPTVVIDTIAHQNPSQDPVRNFLGNCSSFNHISCKNKFYWSGIYESPDLWEEQFINDRVIQYE